MPDTTAQRLKQLDQERATLVAGAKKEALARATQSIGELNALGFNYELVAGGKQRTRKGTRMIKDAPCPACGFMTSPPHDARAHRSQGNRKRAFTAAQLVERGYEKVS
jgi:hypothetical protein